MSVREESLRFKDSEGHSVASILAVPDAPTDRAVILSHGFASQKNSTTNSVLTGHLVGQGLATFRFDFFGHGDSEGMFEDITVTIALDQVLRAIDLVSAKFYGRIGLVGSSFGGLIATLAAARRRDLVCLGLKCPVVDFGEELRLELGETGMAEWKATGTVPDFTGAPGRVRLRYAFYEDALRHLGYDAAPHLTIPTLIVQGDADELIPLHQSRRLYEAMPITDKRLQILPGADHRFSRDEDFRTMTELLTDWMITHLPASDQGRRA